MKLLENCSSKLAEDLINTYYKVTRWTFQTQFQQLAAVLARKGGNESP